LTSHFQDFQGLQTVIPISSSSMHSFLHAQKQKVQMYYGSGTGKRGCICAGQTLHVHSAGGSTFWHEMAHGRHLENVMSNRKYDYVN